jgi:hypothetical protein
MLFHELLKRDRSLKLWKVCPSQDVVRFEGADLNGYLRAQTVNAVDLNIMSYLTDVSIPQTWFFGSIYPSVRRSIGVDRSPTSWNVGKNTTQHATKCNHEPEYPTKLWSFFGRLAKSSRAFRISGLYMHYGWRS